MPESHTPKLVTIKNIQAPTNAPLILRIIELNKYLDTIPIIKTLPQVNNTVEWKPIIKSVIIKLINRTGRQLIPNNAGT